MQLYNYGKELVFFFVIWWIFNLLVLLMVAVVEGEPG